MVKTKYDGMSKQCPDKIRRPEDCMTPDELDTYLEKIEHQIIRRDWIFYSLIVFAAVAFVAFCFTFLI